MPGRRPRAAVPTDARTDAPSDVLAGAPSPPVSRLGEPDAGELLTVQRAAYVTEAQLHDDVRLAPLTQSLGELVEELRDPAVTALGVRDDLVHLTKRLDRAGVSRPTG